MREVIAFCGGDDGVGCTMIAQSAAELLAESHPGKVLMVFGSGKYGDDFILNREGHSLDAVRANLTSGSMAAGELYPHLVRERNLRILPAIRDSLSAGYYPEECMQTLLQAAEGFSYVVIDCGSRHDLGLFISGIKAATRRYFVVTQQEKCLRRFQYAVREIYRPLGVEGQLVVNKHQVSPALLSAGEIEDLTGMETAVRIPYVSYGWQAEMEKQTLLGCGKYAKALKRLTRQIQGEGDEGLWQRKRSQRKVLMKTSKIARRARETGTAAL